MMWQHKAKLWWFSTDISPLTIEVRVIKTGSAWRVKSDAGVFFQGKADHPLEAMKVGEKHALEVAKRYQTPAKDLTKSEITKQFAEQNNMEYKDLTMSEDVTVVPGEPSSSNH